MATILEECKAVGDYIVEVRRRLHQIPELGIHNPKTQTFICAELDKLGIPYQKNKVVHDGVQDTGIVALIEGKNTEKVLALRADTDALPVLEKLDVAYHSTCENQMHACGHDNHCAILLGAAKVLAAHKEQLNGSVKLLFQAGEEIVTGAKLLIEGGCLENPKVTACMGVHVWPMPQFKPGTAVGIPGCMMASGSRFSITVRGAGSHGSQPQLGRDPLVCATQIVSALQNISSREIAGDEPHVLSICQIHAGSAWNIVPNEAFLEGTTRTTAPETQALYIKRIEEIVAGVSTAMRCESTVEWIVNVPPVLNDPVITALAAESAREILGEDYVSADFKSSMGNEDFSFYQEKVPGAFFFLNISNDDPATQYPNHSPYFQVDESILWHGAALHVQTALNYLK